MFNLRAQLSGPYCTSVHRVWELCLVNSFSKNVFVLFSRQGLLQPRMALNLLGSEDDPPTSTSPGLGVQACASMARFILLDI